MTEIGITILLSFWGFFLKKDRFRCYLAPYVSNYWPPLLMQLDVNGNMQKKKKIK